MGAAGLPRGARVLVRLGEIDEVTLDIHGTVIERLDAVADAGTQADDAGDDDEEASAGPIAIAVDMSESPDDAPATPQEITTP